MNDDLDVRVSVLETKVESLDTVLGRVEDKLEAGHKVVFDIKSRLDTQSGFIPAISESIKHISEHQEKMSQKQEDIFILSTSNALRLKIL